MHLADARLGTLALGPETVTVNHDQSSVLINYESSIVVDVSVDLQPPAPPPTPEASFCRMEPPELSSGSEGSTTRKSLKGFGGTWVEYCWGGKE